MWLDTVAMVQQSVVYACRDPILAIAAVGGVSLGGLALLDWHYALRYIGVLGGLLSIVRWGASYDSPQVSLGLRSFCIPYTKAILKLLGIFGIDYLPFSYLSLPAYRLLVNNILYMCMCIDELLLSSCDISLQKAGLHGSVHKLGQGVDSKVNGLKWFTVFASVYDAAGRLAIQAECAVAMLLMICCQLAGCY